MIILIEKMIKIIVICVFANKVIKKLHLFLLTVKKFLVLKNVFLVVQEFVLNVQEVTKIKINNLVNVYKDTNLMVKYVLMIVKMILLKEPMMKMIVNNVYANLDIKRQHLFLLIVKKFPVYKNVHLVVQEFVLSVLEVMKTKTNNPVNVFQDIKK